MMTLASERIRLGLKPGVSTFTIALVGLLAANLSPLMLLALDGIGVAPIAAGGYMTVNLLATAVSALITMQWVAGLQRRRVAQIGTGLGILGFGGAALAGAPGVWVIACLFIAGIGAGAAASAGGAALAGFQGSNRVVGLNVLFNRGIMAILLALIPAIALTMLSTFGIAALVCVFALALTMLLPQTDDLPGEGAIAASTGSQEHAPVSAVTWGGFALLVLFAIWALSEDSLWAIAGVMGFEQAGLNDQLLGLVLSLSTVGGLLGALIVVVTGTRLPRHWALLAVLVLGGAFKLGSAFATDAIVFAALLVGWNFIYGIAYTYFVATAAGLDAKGRWSGPIVGAYLIGSSFAPLFATWVSGAIGYAGFGWVIGGISVLLAIPVVLIAKISMRVESAVDDATPRLQTQLQEGTS